MHRRRFLTKVGAGLGGAALLTGGVAVGTRQLRGGGAETALGPSRQAGATDPEGTATDAETPGGAGTYFVSPDGNDSNPGTRDRPFRTLATAVDAVNPGETVLLRGGIYERRDSVVVSGLAGEPGSRITIAGHPGERPVFRFDGPVPGGEDADGGLVFSDVQHLTVSNLVVRDSPHVGVRVTSSSTDNRFENLTAIHNNLAGFGVYGASSHNLLKDLVGANNYDPQGGGSNADGLQFSNTVGNTVLNGRFYFNSDDGLDLWASRDFEVRNCVSWANGRGEDGGGNGFKLGGDDTSGGHTVARNVAFQNRSIGFMYNSATIPIDVFNNTAWRNDTNYWFDTVDHHLVNNISSHGEVSTGPAVEEDRNSWNLGIENPEFTSYDPRGERFLHLPRDSPCIDAGRDVGVEYAGEAPDLGAYEFVRSAR